jgi:hypothetical protein
VSAITDRRLLAVIRAELQNFDSEQRCVAAYTWEALTELEARADERERLGLEWPELTFKAALALLGPSIQNRQSPRRKGLDRKIATCLRAWQDAYGPWNPKQADYADSVLASCFKPGMEIAQVYDALDRRVAHETVHAGFLGRVG